MYEKLIREIGRSQRLDILLALKRGGAMTVKELAGHFRMSYMGIKQHCLDLEKEGYLDTWRRPVAKGRPEMLYRLTSRSQGLFPGVSNQLTVELLEAIQQTYGPAAPTKLLFGIFNQRAEHYRSQIQFSGLTDRAEGLARLRDAEGYLAEFSPPGYRARRRADTAASGDLTMLRITEHHSPVEPILRRYPILARLEQELFARVLASPVRREESCAPGVYCCTFYVGQPRT